MLEFAQKKLREAQFFFRHLAAESRRVVVPEPEAFDFYLSAFLSSARSVEHALHYEKKKEFNLWFQQWAAHNQSEYEFLDQMFDLRDAEVHRAGAGTNTEWEVVPMIEALEAGFEFMGSPWAEKPQVKRKLHRVKLGKSQEEVVGTCKRCLELLEKIIKEFSASHS